MNNEQNNNYNTDNNDEFNNSYYKQNENQNQGDEYNSEGKERRGSNGYYGSYQQDPDDYAFRTVVNNGRPKTRAWSVSSLVCGIVAVVCCFFGWSGLALGAVAIFCAIMSRVNLGYFDGMSIAGLILGIFGFVMGLFLVIAIGSIPSEFWEEFYSEIESGGSIGEI